MELSGGDVFFIHLCGRRGSFISICQVDSPSDSCYGWTVPLTGVPRPGQCYIRSSGSCPFRVSLTGWLVPDLGMIVRPYLLSLIRTSSSLLPVRCSGHSARGPTTFQFFERRVCADRRSLSSRPLESPYLLARAVLYLFSLFITVFSGLWYDRKIYAT